MKEYRSKISPKVLFIADPWKTLDHTNDSTIHLAHTAMLEHQAECFWACPQDLYLKKDAVFVSRPRILHFRNRRPLLLEENEETLYPLSFFHSVHWRVDPPVTEQTFLLWQMLAATSSPILNSPIGLLKWNEKFSSIRFSEWSIPSLIASEPNLFEDFFFKHRREGVILKPTSNAASRGVLFLKKNSKWSNVKAEIQKLQKSFGNTLLMQPFKKQVFTQGETRAFIVNGKIEGALKKIPNQKSPVMDFDKPSLRPQLILTSLSRVQRLRAARVAAELMRDGIFLACVDFIGDKILEINVTSVGLIKWMDEHLPPAKRLAKKYWKGIFKP